MQLGFWKGLLGSLAVFWMLFGATVGCVLGIGLWLRRKEYEASERRRQVSAKAQEVGRRSSGRRMRWLDQVEVGVEFEKRGGVTCDLLTVYGRVEDVEIDLGNVCRECLLSNVE